MTNGKRTTEPSVAIPVALIAALSAWIAVDRSFGAVPKPAMSQEYLDEAAANYTNLSKVSPHLRAEYDYKEQIYIYRNTALALGLAGGVLGLCFGLVAGIERNQLLRALTGAGMGMIIGVVSGIAAGYAGSAVSEFAQRHKVEPRSPAEMNRVWLQEMYTSMGIHATEWCLIGAGLAVVFVLFGHPARAFGRNLVGAVGAGLLAAVAFTPIAATVFPDARSNTTVPEGFWNQLLFVSLATAAFAVLLVLQKSRSPAAAGGVP